MIRLLAAGVVAFLADAVALVVAAQILDDMALDVSGFLIAVAVFTLVLVLVQPLLRQMAVQRAPALLGSTALAATLVSLIVAAVLTDGLRIEGFTTWVLATVIVWLVALAGRLLLPLVIFKKALANRADR